MTTFNGTGGSISGMKFFSYILFFLAANGSLPMSSAYAPLTPEVKSSPTKSFGVSDFDSVPKEISRRSLLLNGVAAGLMGPSILFGNIRPANADITNALASPAALISVKRAKKQLDAKLPAIIQASDYIEIKAFLRTPPFSDVRVKAYVLVRGGEGGPQEEALQTTYKAFIRSIEKMDGSASLGMRGRIIPQSQLDSDYSAVEATLDDFIKVAEEAAPSGIKYE